MGTEAAGQQALKARSGESMTRSHKEVSRVTELFCIAPLLRILQLLQRSVKLRALSGS